MLIYLCAKGWWVLLMPPYVVELLDRFTAEFVPSEEGENRSLYRLLVDTLRRISQGEDL